MLVDLEQTFISRSRNDKLLVFAFVLAELVLLSLVAEVQTFFQFCLKLINCEGVLPVSLHVFRVIFHVQLFGGFERIGVLTLPRTVFDFQLTSLHKLCQFDFLGLLNLLEFLELLLQTFVEVFVRVLDEQKSITRCGQGRARARRLGLDGCG